MRRKIIALVLWMLILSVSVAFSQTMMDLSTLNLGIQQIRENTFLFDSINRSSTTTTDKGTSSRAEKRRSPTGTQSPLGSNPNKDGGGGIQLLIGQTTFNPVTNSIMPQRLAAEMARIPAERPKLEKFLNDLMKDYKEMASAKGAPLNDVARASSFAAGTSYDVYNENRLLGTRAFEAMREQMRVALAGSEKFKRLDDRRRQEMYETYIIIGMVVSVMYENAIKNNDRELAAKMRELARKQLEDTFGVPISRMKFTDTGVKF
jgi:hypothetical protein